MAAAMALAGSSPALGNPAAPLLPSLEEIRKVSRQIALAVAAEAQRVGVARASSKELDRLVEEKMWTPRYVGLRRRGD